MKIVHAANFSLFKYGANYYFTDDKISNGLIRNGHYVYNFSYRDVARSENWLKTKSFGAGKANKRLIETCDHVKPELLLLGHSEIITVQTLQTIKARHPEIKIAMWYVDPLWLEHHAANIRSKLPALDVFFATTGGDLLRQFKRPGLTVSYMPNIADASVEVHRNFERDDLPIEFLFCGRDYKEPERQAFLVDIAERLSSRQSRFFGCLNQPLLFGHTYTDTLGQAKTGLSYNRRNDVQLYMSDRIVQLTGNGIVAFSPKIPGMTMLYADDEVVYFDDSDDLIDKVMQIVSQESLRKRIAYNGWKKTHEAFNGTRVTAFLLETIYGKPYSAAYEWTDEIY